MTHLLPASQPAPRRRASLLVRIGWAVGVYALIQLIFITAFPAASFAATAPPCEENDIGCFVRDTPDYSQVQPLTPFVSGIVNLLVIAAVVVGVGSVALIIIGLISAFRRNDTERAKSLGIGLGAIIVLIAIVAGSSFQWLITTPGTIINSWLG